MMKMLRGLVVVALVGACSSSTEGTEPIPCPDIAGNYTVAIERIAGTCDSSFDEIPLTFSIRKNSETDYTALIPGVAGGCPADYDTKTCKLRGACNITNADGVLVGTLNVDYAFTDKGYTGTSVSGINPPAVPQTCDVTYRETGTKL